MHESASAMAQGAEGRDMRQDDGALSTTAPGNDAPFALVVDADRQFLRLTLRGQWDEAIYARFAAAYLAAVAELDRHGGVLHSLTDTSGYGILKPDIAERFPGLIQSTRLIPGRRTAMVTSEPVNKVQARDVTHLLNARYFRSVDDAMAWLFSDEA